MKTLAEIRARQTEIKVALDEIITRSEPLDDDITRSDELLTEWDTLEADAKPLQERADRMARVQRAAADPANLEPAFHAPQVLVKKDPFADLEMLVRSGGYGEDLIARTETALTDYRPRHTSDASAEAALETIKRSQQPTQAALHALVYGSSAYQSAFSELLRTQGQPQYTSEEAQAVRAANEFARASLSLTGSTGGYVLPTLLDPTLIHTGTATKDPIRSIARVVTGTQNVWHGVSVGNVTTYWVAENTALTDGSPTFSNPSVTASKLTAYVTASYEIFEDSNLQGQLPGLIGEAMAYAEGTTFITGSGSGAPKGIVTAVSGTAGSLVTCTTRGSFTTASAVDVYAIVNALPSRYESTSTWVANKATFNIIRQMSATGGTGSLFWTNFNNDALGAQPLLGSPIVQASDVATAQTSGTILAILGDFSQFVIYDRIGMAIEFVQNVVDTSGLPLGQRGMIAHKRVGSDVTDLNAFRLLKT